jgi:hypothetical protein
MPFQQLAKECTFKRMCKTGGITFYIGYAQFPNVVDFHRKNNQLRYPNLVYSYYSVDKQVFHRLLRHSNTR